MPLSNLYSPHTTHGISVLIKFIHHVHLTNNFRNLPKRSQTYCQQNATTTKHKYTSFSNKPIPQSSHHHSHTAQTPPPQGYASNNLYKNYFLLPGRHVVPFFCNDKKERKKRCLTCMPKHTTLHLYCICQNIELKTLIQTQLLNQSCCCQLLNHSLVVASYSTIVLLLPATAP